MRTSPWLILVSVSACADPDVTDHDLTPAQRARAEELTSLFENDTIEIQYAYAEDLDDGRGITCGRARFTTATGDALVVIELYTARVPDNVLSRYLPALRTLARDEDDDTSALGGFIAAWSTAAMDPVFRAVQDEVVDELYYRPAKQHADALGLQAALSRAVLYDTIIQHGDGDDPDGLPALLDRTTLTPLDEHAWLGQFLEVRRDDLAHAFDPETREAWAESVGRVDVFRQIYDADNTELHGPIVIHTADYDATIP